MISDWNPNFSVFFRVTNMKCALWRHFWIVVFQWITFKAHIILSTSRGHDAPRDIFGVTIDNPETDQLKPCNAFMRDHGAGLRRCRVSTKLTHNRLCWTRHPLHYSPKRQEAFKRKYCMNKQEVNEEDRSNPSHPTSIEKKTHIMTEWWQFLSTNSKSCGCPCGFSCKGYRGFCRGVLEHTPSRKGHCMKHNLTFTFCRTSQNFPGVAAAV